MKTAYYTFTTWEGGAMAAGCDSGLGGEHRAALVRRPTVGTPGQDRDKVIDLTAWRAANLDEEEAEVRDGLDWDEAGPDWTAEEPPAPAPAGAVGPWSPPSWCPPSAW